jgi:hypothetical protein
MYKLTKEGKTMLYPEFIQLTNQLIDEDDKTNYPLIKMYLKRISDLWIEELKKYF